MGIINNVNEVLHRIRVKLYPNYLPGLQGTYIARTKHEASLTIEEICAELKKRGGFTGNYNDLVEYVLQFLDELAYQLCDGFAADLGYFSIHPNIGGTFERATEGHDEEKHPVTFRFRTRAKLRALAELIAIYVEGLADVNGYIDEFIDVSTEAVNEALTPGGMFSIAGHKFKVAGDYPEVGVYFVSTADPTQRVKVTGHLAENTSVKVIGIVPTLTVGSYTLEVVTQFSSGSSFLKEPRTIAFNKELTVS
jgi:hypothetical protein